MSDIAGGARRGWSGEWAAVRGGRENGKEEEMILKKRQTRTLAYLWLATVLLGPAAPRLAAQDPALRIDENGNVGLGTSTPEQAFHVKRSSHLLALFESTGGAVQMRMRANTTNRRFVALDGSNTVQSQIVFGDDGAFQFLGQTVLQQRMAIDSSGNLTVQGNCGDGNGGGGGFDGCDAVFDPSYDLPSSEEHAAYMWRHKHLPAVGPTPDGEPISFSLQKRHFAVLNELEKAHIYIEQLNDRLNDKEAQYLELAGSMGEKDRQIAELNERMGRLESALLRSAGD